MMIWIWLSRSHFAGWGHGPIDDKGANQKEETGIDGFCSTTSFFGFRWRFISYHWSQSLAFLSQDFSWSVNLWNRAEFCLNQRNRPLRLFGSNWAYVSWLFSWGFICCGWSCLRFIYFLCSLSIIFLLPLSFFFDSASFLPRSLVRLFLFGKIFSAWLRKFILLSGS